MGRYTKQPRDYSKDSGILEIRTVQKYIETVTKNAGLRCQFKDNIPGPMTTKNSLLLPKLNGNITQKDLKKLRWFVLHESLHHTKGPASFDMLRNEFGEGHEGNDLLNDPLFSIYNIIEDERIEKAGAKDYKGDAIILDEGWKISTDETVPIMERVLQATEVSDNQMRMMAIWYEAMKSRVDWSPAVIPMMTATERNNRPELEKFLKLLEDKNVAEKIKTLSEEINGHEDSFSLAKQVYELLFDEKAQSHLDKKKAEGQRKLAEKGMAGGSKDNPGDAEGQGKGDGEGKAMGKVGDGGNAKRHGEGEGKPVDRTDGGTVSYELFNRSKHSIDPRAPGGTGITFDYTEYIRKRGSYPVYVPGDSIKVRYYRTDRESHSGLKAHEHMYYTKASQTVELVEHHRASEGSTSKGFGNKIRQLLQIRSQAKYVGGQKKGRLHYKNVFRACLPVESYNERIFRRRDENDTLDTCVSVLTDLSGSMNGTKLIHAIESSILLNESISRALRIPVEISGFSEYGDETFVGIIKEFDQPISNEDVLKNFGKATCFMSANADGEAIQFAYDRIRERGEKRKILIVISDGQPACSRSGDIYDFTLQTIKQIEGDKTVELYAIGIMYPNVKDLYSNYVIINNAGELENQLLTLIKRSIFK